MGSEHNNHGSKSLLTRERWLSDFTWMLRERGASGALIGDAVAVVESHCDDSGEEPMEAFGEPAAYIETLHLPDQAPTHWATTVVIPVLGLVAGVDLTLGAVFNWSSEFAITWGFVVSKLLLVACCAILIAFFPGRTAHWRTNISFVVIWYLCGFALMFCAGVFLRQELLRIPAFAALALGLICVVTGVLGMRRIPLDPIIDPRRS